MIRTINALMTALGIALSTLAARLHIHNDKVWRVLDVLENGVRFSHLLSVRAGLVDWACQDYAESCGYDLSEDCGRHNCGHCEACRPLTVDHQDPWTTLCHLVDSLVLNEGLTQDDAEGILAPAWEHLGADVILTV